jgi:succinate dehydrogenase flavin-adding protein (antitoxin of CptAB toxin-antitoxin module)
MGAAKGSAFLAERAETVAKAHADRLETARGSTTRATASSDEHATSSVVDPLRDIRHFASEVKGEDAELANRRRRLQFQSRYRGMWELDMILGSFAADCVAPVIPEGVASIDELRVAGDELDGYDAILRQYDNDLNHWLVEIAVHTRTHGMETPVQSDEGLSEPLRGAVPERLAANPVWEKLVRYVLDNRDRIQLFK